MMLGAAAACAAVVLALSWWLIAEQTLGGGRDGTRRKQRNLRPAEPQPQPGRATPGRNPAIPGRGQGSLAPFREHSTVAESLPEEMVPMAKHYPPEYLEFVRLFNEGKYAESHRVLHDIWSENRSNYFYKALIQMAGSA